MAVHSSASLRGVSTSRGGDGFHSGSLQSSQGLVHESCSALVSLLQLCSRCLDVLPMAVESMRYFTCVAILNFLQQEPIWALSFQGAVVPIC